MCNNRYVKTDGATTKTGVPIEEAIECPSCHGSGWIWSDTIPGLRKRCETCGGLGGVPEAGDPDGTQ